VPPVGILRLGQHSALPVIPALPLAAGAGAEPVPLPVPVGRMHLVHAPASVPAHSSSLRGTASTWCRPSSSSQLRSAREQPWTVSPVTQAIGTLASRARASMRRANCGLVAKGVSGASPTARNRSGSSVQAAGRYSSLCSTVSGTDGLDNTRHSAPAAAYSPSQYQRNWNSAQRCWQGPMAWRLGYAAPYASTAKTSYRAVTTTQPPSTAWTLKPSVLRATWWPPSPTVFGTQWWWSIRPGPPSLMLTLVRPAVQMPSEYPRSSFNRHPSKQQPRARSPRGCTCEPGQWCLMPRPGGEADKLGNRYESLWTVDAALDLINGEYLDLTVEAVGDEAAGVEFVRTTQTGGRE